MDASAYLRNQGWRGQGHSLDQTDRGIKKPLLVSKKVDVLGVGVNKHAAVSDQWWLRAYDQGLKDLGTGKEGALSHVQKHGVNRGGLYARFVKGEGVPGTMGQSAVTSTIVAPDALATALPSPSSTTAQSAAPSNPSIDLVEGDVGTKLNKKRKEPSEGKRVKRKGIQEAGELDQDSSTDRKKQRKSKSKQTSQAPKIITIEQLSSEKLALYRKRAAEKKVDLDTYMKRRAEKALAQKAGKERASSMKVP